MLFVPDASVLLKWVLRSTDEPDHDRALALRDAWLADDCDLAVPSLWIYEVGNVLGAKQPAAAAAALRALAGLGLREEGPHGYTAGILGLMAAHRVTFYDAAYHALAQHLGGTMVTADAAYVKKAGSAGHLTLLAGWRI